MARFWSSLLLLWITVTQTAATAENEWFDDAFDRSSIFLGRPVLTVLQVLGLRAYNAGTIPNDGGVADLGTWAVPRFRNLRLRVGYDPGTVTLPRITATVNPNFGGSVSMWVTTERRQPDGEGQSDTQCFASGTGGEELVCDLVPGGAGVSGPFGFFDPQLTVFFEGSASTTVTLTAQNDP